MPVEIHIPAQLKARVLSWCYINVGDDKWRIFNHTILGDMTIIQLDREEDACMVKIKFGL